MGSRAREDILQVINRPKRYISRDAMPDETVSFEKMKVFYAEKDWIAERIESLEAGSAGHRPDVTSGSRQLYPPGHGIRRISDRVCGIPADAAGGTLETADELKESAAGFKTFDEWFAHIRHTGGTAPAGSAAADETDAITLATMHSAKGLEFPLSIFSMPNEASHRTAARCWMRIWRKNDVCSMWQ